MKVLELYCGMGGMHWALKLSQISYEIVAAMEINPVVLEIYSHNFPTVNASKRNIESLTANELNSMNIDMIVMSPPCQPFCRTGLQQDTKDSRTSSLIQLCAILPEVDFKYLLVENVMGFETSDARNELISALLKCGFQWQEFLLTPKTYNIPNSRLRYYLIGKKANLQWSFNLSSEILSCIPKADIILENYSKHLVQNDNNVLGNIIKIQCELWATRKDNKRSKAVDDSANDDPDITWRVSDILEDDNPSLKEYSVPGHIIEKYEKAMDIIDKNSTNTCCFTKGYGHFVKGTGSVLKITDKSLPDSYSLRYFSPREIARLMCYPEEFEFPKTLSVQQQYKALGNSLNVYIVSLLIATLVSE